MLSMLDELAQKSWTVQNNWLTTKEGAQLLAYAQAAHAKGQFKSAGIGKAASLAQQVRGDQIFWLDPQDSPLCAIVDQKLRQLQQMLNETLYLGLGRYEAHFAVYPPGSFYQRHLDQSPQKSAVSQERVLSFVLYLNENWDTADGGELVIYDPDHPDQVWQKISPEMGRWVLFLSEKISHEVRVAERERWSLTAWFHRH